MTDEEIARELERRDLQGEYLRELCVSIGIRFEELPADAALERFDAATLDERRAAALRVLGRAV